MRHRLRLASWLLLLLLSVGAGLKSPAGVVSLQLSRLNPLPSWNDDPTRTEILDFVSKVTDPGNPEFVPAAERIATFDNDGTLWPEQPIYFQFAFALDRVKELASQHPEWNATPPFKAVLENDLEGVKASSPAGLVALLTATHTGMTTEEFTEIVKKWIGSARHPRFQRLYPDLAYQPMIELLEYLRANGFKTYIVSGGTVEFMRAWTQRVYGIPPEQVIGTSFVTNFQQAADGKPVLIREPKIDFVDDGAGKPVGIQKFIGRRPILAFGNSDGDQQMLEWTAAGNGARLVGLIHHTDSEREWAYDRQSSVGKLDKALDEAILKGWLVVDMKESWKVIYPFQE